jgi:hypothetical protein
MTRSLSFWEIEQKLSDHYLRSDGDFGAAPLSFLDASDEELATALEVESTTRARSTLLRCFNPHSLRDVYATGNSLAAPRDVEAPGWFSYLVLSCVIAATTSEDSDIGNFRGRLTEQLDTAMAFTDLRGIAIMWKRLKHWCDEQRKEQKPYRQIDLPDPGNWSHIGYTLRIAFPSRRDVDRISRHLTEDRPDLTKPLRVVRYVEARLDSAKWSEAFVSAFSDFRRRVERGERILGQHPFLMAMEQVVNTGTIFRHKQCEIQIMTDIDGQSVATITFPNAKSAAAAGITSGSSATMGMGRLLKALQSADSQMSNDDVSLCFNEGVIPFITAEWGIWDFTRTPTKGQVRFLLRGDFAKRLNHTHRGNHDEWALTSAYSLEQCIDLLSHVRPDFRTSTDTILPRPSITGGIRVGKQHLGLTCCLPSIRATEQCDVALSATNTANGTPSIERSDQAEFSIKSSTPLDGVWIAKITERGSPVVDLKLKFTSKALEHEPETYATDPTKWLNQVELQNDIFQAPPEQLQQHFPDHELKFPQILEAIYAGGIGGWEESRLIPLLTKCLDSRINPWDALHILADSGWLVPRASSGWRATRWFLREPHIIRLARGRFLLEGSHCESIRARFNRAAAEAGCAVEWRDSGGDWNVPALLCCSTKTSTSEPHFGLPIVDANISLPLLSSPCDFRQSPSSERSRMVRSHWSWERGRFLKGVSPQIETVSLERLQHNGDRAPDLFRVRGPDGSQRYFDSRTAAILVASDLAHKPIFTWQEESHRLVRTVHEGWLPTALSTFVRFSMGHGPAINLTTGASVYSYSMQQAVFLQLKKWIGSAINVGHQGPSSRKMVLAKRLGVPGLLIGSRDLHFTRGQNAS